MVTGAVGAIIYGEPRLTRDIDLVVELFGDDAPRLVRAFPLEDFHTPPEEVIRDEVRRRVHGHFNLIHHATSLKADMYLLGDDALHHWGFPRRRKEKAGDDDLWVAPIEYVIVRKLEYFREGRSEKHLQDIRQMLVVSGDRVDRSELTALIDQSEVQKEWQMVEAGSG